MRLIAYTAFVIICVFALLCKSPPIIILDDNSTQASIQMTIDTKASIIVLPNKRIEIEYPLILSHSNQKIIGQSNTLLVLKSNANCPVIIIGIQEKFPIQNVSLETIKIDGNRLQQPYELWQMSSNGLWTYNNGIIVQNSKNVKVSHVKVSNCRSGGLVSTYYVSHLIVVDCEFYGNRFDGIACYKTTESVFENIKTHDNLAAGISLDLDFNDNRFENVEVHNNDIGIFMRKSNENKFLNVKMTNNKAYDVFISSVDGHKNTGCVGNVFTLSNSRNIFDRDPQCVSNS